MNDPSLAIQWRDTLAHYRSGRTAEAIRSCHALIASAPRHAGATQLLARLYLEAGDTQQGEAWLRKAVTLTADDGTLLTNLAHLCRLRGAAEEAEHWLMQAVALEPPDFRAAVQLAALMKDTGRDRDAVGMLAPLVIRGDAPAAVLAQRAQCLERLNRLDEARADADAALARDPGDPVANLVLASLDLRADAVDAALERCRAQLHREDLSATNRALAAYLASRACDRLEAWSDAFAAARHANELLQAGYRRRFPADAGPYAPKTLDVIAAWLAEAGPLPSAGDGLRPVPVFLLGFPRSGTTLLEQVLRAHPDVAAIEEEDIVAPLVSPWLADPATLEKALTPDNPTWREARARYTQTARNLARAQADQIVVDKLPLNSVFLPLLARLFPEGKFLLALRDPRDVILSCYLQSFGLNAAMAQFLDLRTATDYYESVMTNLLTARQRLRPRVHEVRYEALVSNLETVAEDMLRFLDLPWRAEVLDYRDRLADRVINTPSRRQVTRPLYRTSLGRWRHYAPDLEPVLGRLTRLAARLGYPA